MKTAHSDFDFNESSIERDLQEIAPLFDDICQNSKLGSPPPEVIATIQRAASKYSLRLKFVHRVRLVSRTAAAAAALALLLAGGVQINSVQKMNRRMEVINQLCIVSDAALQKDESIQASNATLADLLMAMQGFDAETYFAVN